MLLVYVYSFLEFHCPNLLSVLKIHFPGKIQREAEECDTEVGMGVESGGVGGGGGGENILRFHFICTYCEDNLVT